MSPRLRLPHRHPIASAAFTAERLYIGDVLQAKGSAMGLLAQLFRHKNSPQRENPPVLEPDTETLHTEVRGVGAVAEKIRSAHAIKAPVEIVRIPAAAAPAANTTAPAARTTDANDLPTDPAMAERQTAPASPEHAPSEKTTKAPAPREHAPATATISVPTVSVPLTEPPTAAPTPAPAFEASSPEIPPPPISSLEIPAPEIPAPEIPSPTVMLPPPALHETPPPVSVAATEQREQQRELRPEKEVAISTTLRAVVLGGVAPAGSSDAPNSAGQVLAPRVTVKATATPAPLILGPSVIPSANAGGILLAPRTTPDFAGLQKLFITSAALDLGRVAALAAALPGVRACVISGAAGDAMAGDFSHGVSAEEVRAASANLVRRAAGSIETLHRGGSDMVIFLHGETCIAVIPAAGGFVPGVPERLTRAAELLAGAPPPPAR